jgi:adenylate cyclase
MIPPSIRPGPLSETINSNNLPAAIHRFRALHQARLARFREFLGPRRRGFLDLLPLRFHGDPPALPRYIASTTVARITGYHPQREALPAGGQISKSFLYN